MIVAALVVTAVVAGLLGACWALWRDARKQRAFNQALMDGAARNLMGQVAPELAAALERLGSDTEDGA
jgi:hypothetical protein